ncbi:hypothetical protein HK097_011011 [Rhizophlyctis rosea]|uniref:O-acyltransferase n=1 Tax=Rhizophlyctis rosea TaxID=64517 RepID=A0AAD5SIG4_9FUNG|nr:hypothetical protein HK097_011011 [Rhizophlyctis rosea]
MSNYAGITSEGLRSRATIPNKENNPVADDTKLQQEEEEKAHPDVTPSDAVSPVNEGANAAPQFAAPPNVTAPVNKGTDSKSEAPSQGRRLKNFSHTLLIHTVNRASPLSKESPEQDFRGFFNLSMLLLAVSNLRLIIENYMKYGFLLSLPFSGIAWLDWGWTIVSLTLQALNILTAYTLESYAKTDPSPDRPTRYRVKLLHVINITLTITLPTLICWTRITHPAISSISLFSATILFLKLVSYALVCADMRREAALKMFPPRQEEPHARDAKLRGEEANVKGDEMVYPENITLGNIMYFVCAPTLVYQPVYPRTKRFRRRFFVKRLMEFSLGIAAMYLLGAQYAAPTLRNSFDAVKDVHLTRMAERILKLSLISVVMWLLMFWCFFHCWLNMIAEVLRFGDRRFYLPWWNAKDVSEYWRLWNTPVYNWGKRHVYLPLIINHKVQGMAATLVVFTISALLHELLIGIPTHTINGWAFSGMMAQIPLVLGTQLLDRLRERFRNQTDGKIFDTIGNYIFWISFTIVGQPTCVLIYYYHYVARQKAMGL